jgi:triacylglycerol lipase
MPESHRRNPAEVLPEVSLESIAPPYLNYRYFEGHQAYPFHHRATRFNMVNAWWLIEAATLAYAEAEFVSKVLRPTGLTEVRPFSGTSTQCYVAHNDDLVMVAFRGTEIRKRPGRPDIRNIIADLKADCDLRLTASGQGGRVHQGFKDALDEVWETQGLLDYIRSLHSSRRSMWFTGHSLGAALATLAADRYGDVDGLYTFGSPRVGDIDFKIDFHINAYRFVNNNDIVARVPPPGLYKHVGELKYIDSKGLIHDNPSRWERLTDNIRGEIAYLFNALGQIRSGFANFLPDDIIDHVPTLYATHIWNNI